MPLKISERLNTWAARKDFYRACLLISLFSLLIFLIVWGYIFLLSRDAGSGFTALIFPPIMMSVLLLFMSCLALFYYMKKGVKISRVVFVVMVLLSIPVILCAGWGLLLLGVWVLN